MNNLPTARVDDILIHPRDNDLIVATHARGIWIADDISRCSSWPRRRRRIRRCSTCARRSHISDRQSGQQVGGQKVFVGENPARGAALNYYLPAAATGDVKLTIADATGRVIRTLDGTKNAGINRIMWNLTPGPPPGQAAGFGGGRGGFGGQAVDPGTYLVTLTANGKTSSKPVQVLQDMWLREK